MNRWHLYYAMVHTDVENLLEMEFVLKNSWKWNMYRKTPWNLYGIPWRTLENYMLAVLIMLGSLDKSARQFELHRNGEIQ